MSRADDDERTRRRRLDVVRLPVSMLRRHGYLAPSVHDVRWQREPLAVGIGPDGDAYAVWSSRDKSDRLLVTRHNGGKKILATTVIEEAERARFVQPLPGGRLLLARGRSRPGSGAQIWTGDGELVAAGHLGDAIEHMLATPSGAIWVGYFDEAMSGTGPQAHGLARFTADLNVDWVYPFDAGLPVVFDCYALNVADETVAICAYTEFHVTTVTGSTVTDHGPSPHRGATNLLLDGNDAALVGGYAAEYDQITPIRLGPNGIEPAGELRRLILPDGMEVRSARYFCRGADLHVIIGTAWYRVDLAGLRGRG